MAIEQSIEQVMKEIGPLADLCAVRAYPAERMWQLAVDEETIVFAELAPSGGNLVLSAELGPPPDIDRANFYEFLLRYAHAWHLTEGLRIGLAEGDASLWLLRDCCAVDLAPLEFPRCCPTTWPRSAPGATASRPMEAKRREAYRRGTWPRLARCARDLNQQHH
jgi:hypothetical protein